MKHFEKKEFACKCGCGLNNMKDPFLARLERARGIAEVKFIITSGCRCLAHNKKEGGVEDSAHPKGQAVDIKALSSDIRFRIMTGLLLAGFVRIGISEDFIHIDDDETKPQNVMWLY